ncbi:MAG: hypothetical protein Q4D99_06590 [Bacillota bacterium]|nr:hypothetical protein [Bacillota bacterium]
MLPADITPQDVFNNPANLFVAGFIGMPQMNFFRDCALTVNPAGGVVGSDGVVDDGYGNANDGDGSIGEGTYSVEVLGTEYPLTARRRRVCCSRENGWSWFCIRKSGATVITVAPFIARFYKIL